MPGNGSNLSLTVPGVTNVAQASGAVVLLTYWPHNVATLSYRVNGNAWHTAPWPFDTGATFVSQTLAMPLPLSEVVSGTNTIQLMTSDTGGTSVANVDLLLIGAGGGGSPSNTPVVTPTGIPPTVAPVFTATTQPISTPVPATPTPAGTCQAWIRTTTGGNGVNNGGFWHNEPPSFCTN